MFSGGWYGLVTCVSNAALTVENAYDMLDRVTNIIYRNASATVVGSFASHDDCVMALALGVWGYNRYGTGPGRMMRLVHGSSGQGTGGRRTLA